mmetsp:Transcript_40495/g.82749  ORF Transcript_40495/g.82749 Transcript_40495/m.82749 type:complete len:218 (+) Transcript_40495:898-1551(+)
MGAVEFWRRLGMMLLRLAGVGGAVRTQRHAVEKRREERDSLAWRWAGERQVMKRVRHPPSSEDLSSHVSLLSRNGTCTSLLGLASLLGLGFVTILVVEVVLEVVLEGGLEVALLVVMEMAAVVVAVPGVVAERLEDDLSARDWTTCMREKRLLLMCAASVRLFPPTLESFTRSDPARSTKHSRALDTSSTSDASSSSPSAPAAAEYDLLVTCSIRTA